MLVMPLCNIYILVVLYDVLEGESFVCVVLYSMYRYYMCGKMHHSGAASILSGKRKISIDVKIFIS